MYKREKLSRRDFLNLLKVAGIDFALLALGGVSYGYLVEPGWVVVENVSLKLSRLSNAFSGIRIAQISDIHMGGWMTSERFQYVVDKLVEEKPDLLLLTGDYLLGHGFGQDEERSLQELTDILVPLAKAIPSFGILGNHDYWTNVKAVSEMLQASGITELTNSFHTISSGSEKLHICGVDDIWEGRVHLKALQTQLPHDGAAILLAHEPDFADKSSVTGRFDLQVSGHSHGGQVVVPFYGPPVLPFLGQKYPSGLYKVGDMFQYTNRGVGMARLPIRINCPPEITIFTLESAA